MLNCLCLFTPFLLSNPVSVCVSFFNFEMGGLKFREVENKIVPPPARCVTSGNYLVSCCLLPHL